VHARVTFAQVKPEDIEDSARLFEDGIIPAAREEEGFRGALFLVRDDGTVMAIDLADSLDHLRPTRSTGSTKQRSPSSAAASWATRTASSSESPCPRASGAASSCSRTPAESSQSHELGYDPFPEVVGGAGREARTRPLPGPAVASPPDRPAGSQPPRGRRRRRPVPVLV
jgi:hypothetical protein